MQEHRSPQHLIDGLDIHSDEYSNRIPIPPRIIVPPPNGEHAQILKRHPQFNSATNTLIDDDQPVPAPPAWSYDDRRKGQPILPHLFLGPTTITRDPAFFKTHGITMVICVHSTLIKITEAALQRVQGMGIEAQSVDASEEGHLMRAFPIAAGIFNEHITRLSQLGQVGRVLVCCESGNNRSAALVAAIMMETHDDVDHITAIQIVQTQRFCAVFDENAKRMLQCYWDILSAQRTVAAADHHLLPGVNKRQLPVDLRDVQDEDTEMDADRRQYAPFVEQ